ncbi:uncharacterized protein LOC114854839 [Betta splendens]|uniref:Uncharacterized protein LOC114854839 n=1 Tax=Betta splendens TaxID=158456 RepID=A0A9W2XS85_BETSP|nr:uncharacterized protein LOC114854839 [Betta splendens]
MCASIPPLIPLWQHQHHLPPPPLPPPPLLLLPLLDPPVSCRDLPPPSLQGALPGTGRGREITTSQLAADPRQGIGSGEGRGGNFTRGARGERRKGNTQGYRRKKETRSTLHPDRPERERWQRRQRRRRRPGVRTSSASTRGSASPGPVFSFAEEPLMEPCLTLQRGVFNQCNCPTFSICVCVCLPLEPEGRLLMVAVMAMVEVVVVVMMTMQWQWRCSRDFWLSTPCLLKDSLR